MTFVARYTNHPAEDLDRDWSAPLGGFYHGDLSGMRFETYEAAEREIRVTFSIEDDADLPFDVRFHDAYNGFVEVHYEGLGAFELDSETIEDAINEAVSKFGQDAPRMACVDYAGDGHFSASECAGFHATSVDGLYIFEIN